MKTAVKRERYPDESHYNEIFKRYENNPIIPNTLCSVSSPDAHLSSINIIKDLERTKNFFIAKKV